MDSEQIAEEGRIDIRRSYVLQVRLRITEFDELVKKADKMAISTAAYARMAIKNYRRGA